MTEILTGSEWLARAIASTGTRHVFFIDPALMRIPAHRVMPRLTTRSSVHGIRVEEPAKIAPALQEALAMDAPVVVVDMVTEINDRAPAPWLPEGV
jgi:hypothetical protein